MNSNRLVHLRGLLADRLTGWMRYDRQPLRPKPSGLKAGETLPMVTSTPR